MNGKRTHPAIGRRLLVALTLLAAITGIADAAAATRPKAEQAAKLYDEGSYSAARTLLEEIDSTGESSGPLLYRLYYCQRATGDAELSAETLGRAVERLELESAQGGSLEVAFYLASAFENVGRRDEARQLTKATLRRVENGEFEASSSVDKFRLGKLYADGGDEMEAANWYRAAIDAFTQEGSGNATYIIWASRYLAQFSLGMGDFSAAEMHLTELTRHGKPSVDELDQLAVVRVRNGMYRQAAAAWRESLALRPANADRPRYCAQLATLAARLKQLPEKAPSGKLWTEMTRTELEELLQAQANSVREARVEALQTPDISPERFGELRRQIKAARPIFVAAGLEYALQGYNIREAAFFGGYAPLVFHVDEWRLKKPEPAEEEAIAGD